MDPPSSNPPEARLDNGGIEKAFEETVAVAGGEFVAATVLVAGFSALGGRLVAGAGDGSGVVVSANRSVVPPEPLAILKPLDSGIGGAKPAGGTEEEPPACAIRPGLRVPPPLERLDGRAKSAVAGNWALATISPGVFCSSMCPSAKRIFPL
jgi:hypothetical protein